MDKIKKTIALLCTGSIILLFLSGCSATKQIGVSPAGYSKSSARADLNRKIAWSANIEITVWNVNEAVNKADIAIKENGGYVSNKYLRQESSADLSIYVPSGKLKNLLSELKQLGYVTSQNINSADITEQYIDNDAKLKNKIVLRDRLKKLLDKAEKISEILKIETELSRVQGSIDSMEAIKKSMEKDTEYAFVSLSIEREKVFGPIGYLLKGLWWGIEKLFVISS